MHKALLATFLAAVSAGAVTGPVQADVVDDAALRQAARQGARAAATGPRELPLPAAGKALAASAGGLRSIALSAGPVRVLVGARKHADTGALAAELEEELRNFRLKLTRSAHEAFEAREGKTDDLVLAVAMALWVAERPKNVAEWGPNPFLGMGGGGGRLAPRRRRSSWADRRGPAGA